MKPPSADGSSGQPLFEYATPGNIWCIRVHEMTAVVCGEWAKLEAFNLESGAKELQVLNLSCVFLPPMPEP